MDTASGVHTLGYMALEYMNRSSTRARYTPPVVYLRYVYCSAEDWGIMASGIQLHAEWNRRGTRSGHVETLASSQRRIYVNGSAAAICGHCQCYHPRTILYVLSQSSLFCIAACYLLDNEAYCRAGAFRSRSKVMRQITTGYRQDSRPGQVDMMALIDGGEAPERRQALDSFTSRYYKYCYLYAACS